VGQTAKALRATWRTHYRRLLDLIFEEHSSQKIILGPDDAMDLMEELTESLFEANLQSKQGGDASGSNSVLRFDYDAYRREAHHYAVDRFYKTYFPRKRGAPPLPTAYLDRILQLRFKGMNYVSIAEKLGQPKGRMKKQVEAAEKRWREALARIEQIKQRSPHLVAAEPTAQARKPRSPGGQSKRQKVKARTVK
jgi:hypothetical protein